METDIYVYRLIYEETNTLFGKMNKPKITLLHTKVDLEKLYGADNDDYARKNKVISYKQDGKSKRFSKVYPIEKVVNNTLFLLQRDDTKATILLSKSIIDQIDYIQGCISQFEDEIRSMYNKKASLLSVLGNSSIPMTIVEDEKIGGEKE